jgi:DNA repair protein RecO (recombination protein O)
MLVSTPAIILSTIRYGETSKIVRLATRWHGVQSAIAKGALRPRSRFGASLQLLSAGSAHLILSDRRDLHTLTAFDLHHLRSELAAGVARFATASVLAELMARFAPAEPHPESYDALERSLALLERAEGDQLAAQAVRAIWTLVGALGFSPALEVCVQDGCDLPLQGELRFGVIEGGALCVRCAQGKDVTRLPESARRDLAALVAPEAPLPQLDRRHGAAHRRLLIRYIQYHLAEGARLPALEFWGKSAWR